MIIRYNHDIIRYNHYILLRGVRRSSTTLEDTFSSDFPCTPRSSPPSDGCICSWCTPAQASSDSTAAGNFEPSPPSSMPVPPCISLSGSRPSPPVCPSAGWAPLFSPFPSPPQYDPRAGNLFYFMLFPVPSPSRFPLPFFLFFFNPHGYAIACFSLPPTLP